MRGKRAEALIAQVLSAEGYIELTPKDRQAIHKAKGTATLSEFGHRWFTRHCKHFTNIYGEPFYADFIFRDEQKWPLGFVIESKWQSQQGSADEKYLSTFLTLKNLPVPGALILDGGLKGESYRACVVKYLEKLSDEKTVFIHGISSLMRWTENHL